MQDFTPQAMQAKARALSVIVITRNEAHQLAKCLESVACAAASIISGMSARTGPRTPSFAASSRAWSVIV